MKQDDHYPSSAEKELFHAICSLKTETEAAQFFRDLLTQKEIAEFANRWQMVKLLYKGLSYEKIAKELHTSTATVTRVAYWLRHGMGGYKTIANRLFPIKK